MSYVAGSVFFLSMEQALSESKKLDLDLDHMIFSFIRFFLVHVNKSMQLIIPVGSVPGSSVFLNEGPNN